MEYTDRFRKVTVLGAGGKMGSGILLLTATEICNLSLARGKGGRPSQLIALDVSTDALRGVRDNLRTQVRRVAEKQIVQLRQWYDDRDDLIENWEIIERYISDVMKIVETSTSMDAAKGSTLVFEAVSENPGLKVKLIREIEEHGDGKTWYLTNTSSIPIRELDEAAGLNGRIIGFHFYNPPAVQKLVELITGEGTDPQLKEFSHQLAGALHKKVVPARDIAGFIGNGHFMREIIFGAEQVEKLADDHPLHQALYMVDLVTREWLVRPMGIFQLTDYVGLDVCQNIMKVMDPHMERENLHCELIDRLLEQGVRGGQHPDGSQKDGIFSYEKGQINGVYDPGIRKYISVDKVESTTTTILGSFPAGHTPWKEIIRDPLKDEKLESYFSKLRALNSAGARMAVDYGKNSGKIGQLLVDMNVADSEKDVNRVLLNGFFHAYGPINEYFN